MLSGQTIWGRYWNADYSFEVKLADHWTASSDASGAYGLQGMLVDLDASERQSPLYTIVANDEFSLNIKTDDDLSAAPGNTLQGVHKLNSLHIGGGAHVAFGDDRLELYSIDGQRQDTVRITAADYRVDGLDMHNVIIEDGAKLTTERLTLSGDLTLNAGAIVTTTAAVEADKSIQSLAINVAGTVKVEAGAHIDLDRTGYPGRYSGPNYEVADNTMSCHGGRKVSYVACEYGDYRQAMFAGSGGTSYNTASGGGFVSLQAQQLILDGSISADGENTEGYSGAGGGVHIEVTDFSGGEEATISANGGAYIAPSPGGRISIITDNNAFTGHISAYAGVDTDLKVTDKVAGAGTVYIQEAGNSGRLIIDNAGQPSVNHGTTLRHIGQQTVGSVVNEGDNIWRITRAYQQQDFTGSLAAAGELGAIDYQAITIESDQIVSFDYQHSASRTTSLFIFNDDGSLDASDLVYKEYLYSGTPKTLELAQGAYIFAIAPANNALSSTVAGYTNGGVAQTSIAGTYTLRVAEESVWRSSDEANSGYGLQGLLLDLDKNDDSAPLLSVISNTNDSLLVESTEDLTPYTNKVMQGVHRFESVTVTAGGALSLGGDRLELFDEEGNLDDDMVLESGDWTFDQLHLKSLIVGSEATLTVESLIVDEDMTLNPGAVVMTADAVAASTSLYNFDLQVGGTLHIQAGAHLNFDGKGYPSRYRGPEFSSSTDYNDICHGGRISAAIPCEYGHYRRASYAGSGGQNGAADGGGFANISADRLIVDGVISADGIAQYDSSRGGAGGGLHIVANAISGAATGAIRSNGASSDYPGPGGRVSIHTQLNDYLGSVSSSAGADSNTQTGVFPGAGTQFWQTAGNNGELIVNNQGQQSVDSGTTVVHVGMHTVGQVDNLGNNRWRITPVFTEQIFQQTLAGRYEDGAIQYQTISFETDKDITLHYQHTDNFDTQITLFKDDGALATADLHSEHNVLANSATTVSVEAGDYIIAVSSQSYSISGIVNAYSNNGNGYAQIAGDYILSVADATPWVASNVAEGGLGLEGILVDLDADEEASPLYAIVENTSRTLIIETSDDLSESVGNSFVGHHQLERVHVRAGGKLSFGGDRLTIADVDGSMVDAGSVLAVGDFDSATQAALWAGGMDGEIQQQRDPSAAVDMTLGAGSWQFDSLNVSSLVLQAGAILSTQEINVSGDLTLEAGSVLTVPEADASEAQVYGLKLNVEGVLHIQTGAEINLEGKGYPYGYHGPDFAIDSSYQKQCHGGRPQANYDCEYGDYRNASFAGSGGSDSGLNGGGFAQITAREIIVDGTVNADGSSINDSDRAGAGGGISITSTRISGSAYGDIRANGGSSTHYPGVGGRVSLKVAENNYLGSVAARAGEATAGPSMVAGAGTVFWQVADDKGALIVDNGNQASVEFGTTVRSMGRHQITSVEALGDSQWQITAAGFEASFVQDTNYDEEAEASGEPQPSVWQHSFSLATDTTLQITLQADTDDESKGIWLFRDDGSLDTSDAIAHWNNYNDPQVVSKDLSKGDYVIALANGNASYQEVVDGHSSHYSPFFSGQYSLELKGSGSWTPTSQNAGGYSLQGMQVDLDTSDETSPLYTVVSNTSDSIIVESASDLSDLVAGSMIGVHEFERLAVTGGAMLNFGDDKVIIRDLSSSVMGEGSVMWLGEFDKTTQEALGESSFASEVHQARITDAVTDINLSSGVWAFDTLSLDNLSLDGDAELTAGTVQSSSISLDGGATLTTVKIDTGDLTLGSGTVLSVPDADSSNKLIYSLDLNVSGLLHIQDGAHIDLSGKGYPFRTRGPDFSSALGSTIKRCHGGRSEVDRACEYGDFRQPGFAGSGGYYAAAEKGGGRVNIQADELILDGLISADGLGGSSYAAAGGSITIKANSLSGAASGIVRANGGPSGYSVGAGGRISIEVFESHYQGTAAAAAGVNPYYNSSRPVSGAGTVYWAVNDASGTLVVDNQGQNSIEQGTTVRAIGRHTIASVEPLGNAQWRIAREMFSEMRQVGEFEDPSQYEQSVWFYDISIPKDGDFTLSGTAAYGNPYIGIWMFSDDGALNEDDLVASSKGYNGPSSEHQIAAGDYIIAVTGGSSSIADVVAGESSFAYQIQEDVITVTLESEAAWVSSSEANGGFAVQGLLVDLDATDETSPEYRVIANESQALIVESTDDLSSMVGQQMVGVQTLESLQVKGGAQLNFGDDRIVIEIPENLIIDPDASLSLGSFDAATQQYIDANNPGGTIHQSQP